MDGNSSISSLAVIKKIIFKSVKFYLDFDSLIVHQLHTMQLRRRSIHDTIFVVHFGDERRTTMQYYALCQCQKLIRCQCQIVSRCDVVSCGCVLTILCQESMECSRH